MTKPVAPLAPPDSSVARGPAMRMRDIEWVDHLEEAQRLARERRCPIAIKALGQGTNTEEDWCPAASATRGLALSDPTVAALLNDRFVPVRFSMWQVGPATDLPGRDFVLRDGFYPYPGLIITDPELRVIDRTKPTAAARETLDTLRVALRKRPDLAGPTGSLEAELYDISDPAQAEFVRLQQRFDALPTLSPHVGPGAPGSRKAAALALIPALERWLAAHATRLPDVGAVAQALLGDCHYIIGDFQKAEASWRDVIERFPHHPVRHHCSFNMLDKNVWPEATHPALDGCRRPGVETHPPDVPHPEVRERNLSRVASDPRYRHSPSGHVFVEIPAGTFTMGGSPAIYKNELPLRSVTLTRPYLMAAWPVTRAQWRAFDPRSYLGPEGEGLAGELPAAMMSWNNATEYCRWLSARDGWSYRLPTEAEWERAARGGLEGMTFPWGNEPLSPARANYHLPRPVPVASYDPNAYGLFEIIGNVVEYTADRFLGSAYSLTERDVVDPTGPTPEQQPRNIRCCRASLIGSQFSEMTAYVSWRTGNDADRGTGGFGFRLCCDLPVPGRDG